MNRENDVLILGGGLTGLTAARELGKHATLFEMQSRPGGLVRTDCFDGYWYDRVLHLLHVADPQIESYLKNLLGDTMAKVRVEAWIVTEKGEVRYPFQMHLGDLDHETIIKSIKDLAKLTYSGQSGEQPENFEDFLELSFGETMCELFLLPYNRKVWKHPLDSLAPSGFQWNIARPEFEKVLLGALNPSTEYKSYNVNGWYLRPPSDSRERGMGVLSLALAKDLLNLKMSHKVRTIDLKNRIVTVQHDNNEFNFHFKKHCLSTIPLPTLALNCIQLPDNLRRGVKLLRKNRVLSPAINIRGPRPSGTGLWRYYADESIIFNRLIFMHEFDPLCSPEDGWGILAEITEPAEDQIKNHDEILDRVVEDIYRVGIISKDCEVTGKNLMMADPAYVVFTPENRQVIKDLRRFFSDNFVTPLGRYGKWEYSSMYQAIRDSLNWVNQYKNEPSKQIYFDN